MAHIMVSGMIVDVLNRRIFPGTLHVEHGKIERILHEPEKSYEQYLIPGFVDAHVHVESSMLVPTEFARLAVKHGTVATVSDPHEIANVLGLQGVRYMIQNARQTPLKIAFGAPSCVPATTFESAGATVTAEDIRQLFAEDGLLYLSEMMNFPGVLFQDPTVMEKIRIAQEFGRPVDGHAPGLRGEEARQYITAGISTDHECFTLEEALDKLAFGMKILIREGSAAKNFEALHSLISSHSSQVMLCSDDKHPNDLVVSHLDELVRRAVAKGHDVLDVLTCGCVNPVQHYRLNVGLLQEGDPADFLVVNTLQEFRVLKTYINGECVANNGVSLLPRVEITAVNNFNRSLTKPDDFRLPAQDTTTIRVIEALDGQLITNEIQTAATIHNDELIASVERDILKFTVVNRYQDSPPAVAFIKNFGLKAGAIASSVGHDSHNILAVAVDNVALSAAVNAIIKAQGGIAVIHPDGKEDVLPLPVAGIMTTADGVTTGEEYSRLDALAKTLGSTLHAPFMTLSFMALLVIPDLKLSDKGLFSGKQFTFTNLRVDE